VHKLAGKASQQRHRAAHGAVSRRIRIFQTVD